MRKPISPTMHGVIDYTTSTTLAALALALGFPKPATQLFEGLAAGYTGLSSITDYPLSAKRMVPFKAHGAFIAMNRMARAENPRSNCTPDWPHRSCLTQMRRIKEDHADELRLLCSVNRAQY